MSGSLSEAKGYVLDAFRVQPKIAYAPENVVLGNFSFVPWVRSGLSAAVQAPAQDPVRGSVDVSVTIEDNVGHSAVVSNTLFLNGPGDVVAIDPTQIIRRVPQPGTVDAEESFVAQIEFDLPEYPWLFSPFPSSGEIVKPWLVLVVCDANRAQLFPSKAGLPQQLSVFLSELPSLEDAWAWSHAQVIGSMTANEPSISERLSADHAPVNLSRILCPRKLEPNHSYIACLVPAFDAGVQAGLGKSVGTLGPAWTRAADNSDSEQSMILPCYDNWTFSTAAAGDFHSLAERLVPRAAPWQVGRRIIDTSTPQGSLPALADNAPGATQILHCALVSPTIPTAEEAPAEDAGWSSDMRDQLRQLVDQANVGGHEDLPRVGPRLYGRFQRGKSTIGPVFGAPADDQKSKDADQDWFVDLNTNPLNRIVAGLGTRVVQKDQEALMQAAWAQVGDIESANRALRYHQFGRYVGEALHRKHFQPLALGTLSQVLRGVQSKMTVDNSGLTMFGKVGASAVAPAGMTAAFRRSTRVRGPLTRLAGADQRVGLSNLVAQGSAFRDFRRTYANPDGIGAPSSRALAAIPTSVIAAHLNVPEAIAREQLTQKFALSLGKTSMADFLLSPTTSWRIPVGKFDLGAMVADKIGKLIAQATPPRMNASSAQAEVFAAVQVGLANTNIPVISDQARQKVLDVNASLPFQKAPQLPIMPINMGTRAIQVGPMIAPQQPANRFSAGGNVDLRPISLPPIVTRPPPVVAEVPSAEFRFETSASRAVTDLVAKSRSLSNDVIASAISLLAADTGVLALPLTPTRPALTTSSMRLLQATAPALTMTRYVQSRLQSTPDWLAGDWFANGRIEPIMAAPHFNRPMYEALDDYSRDWLVPGLGKIGQTDFVSLLETNPKFTEALLVGLSDEMGRELLWRGYPTDQRGTYFRRFWDHDQDELSKDIHQFGKPPINPELLGTHLKNDGGESGHLVFVIRGEIVRRYPHAMVSAVMAQSADPSRRPEFTVDVAATIFHAHLKPDIILVGFNLTKTQVMSEPWWFVISEHPTAPRFGLELAKNPLQSAATGPVGRNNLTWNDLGSGAQGALDLGQFLSPRSNSISITESSVPPGQLASMPATINWPGNSATVARTLFRNPLRAAFDGKRLITPQ
jgi:hypothetical protein